MVNKHIPLAAAVLLVAAAVMGCGGGDTAAPTDPAGLKLELLAGTTAADFAHCQAVNGSAAEARFSHLLRIAVYKDAMYLTETDEGCANATYSINGIMPENFGPAIRKLADAKVERAPALNTFGSFGGVIPAMVRHPSGFHRREGSGEMFVLSVVAARSDEGFALDEETVALYTQWGAWSYYAPGLYRRGQELSASDSDFVAGTHDQPPGYADGRGNAARFVAPHDLEVDAAGVFHLIDDGRIRTINADYQVKTLDHTALGITGQVRALDADHQGRIHVLANQGEANYTWHRLADGTKVTFQTAAATWHQAQLQTFTIVGDEMVLGVRDVGGETTRLYRVSATGTVTPVTGTEVAASPQDFLDQPARYALPPVKHIEYGVDGHLYLVLHQGVLIAREFK